MALDAKTFLGGFGFTENPFTMTNADEEPELQSYFVPPPYFASVLGDPARPKSTVVLAPRGGGKTAQKVMIEKASRQEGADRFLCITYDTFLLPSNFAIEDATVEWHLTNISKRLVSALLIAIDEYPICLDALSDQEKNSLAKISISFLSELTAAEFSEIIKSLRNWRGNAEHYWEKYGGKIANLISAVAARFDFGNVDALATKDRTRNTYVDYLGQLLKISQKLGFASVYVLVDRVDETYLTSNNVRSSFDFIKSILSDLHVLELDGIALKFFLWDKIGDFYLAEGARPDRIPLHDLDWTVDQLSEMLSKRLKTYSESKVSSLNEMCESSMGVDVHKLCCFMAAGSPRDMIRFAQRMVDERTKAKDDCGMFSLSHIESALRIFAAERSRELYPQFANDLKRIGAASFTISKISSDVYRVTTQAGRAKVQKWLEWGAVEQTGELPNPGNRPHYLYSVTDPRMAIVAKGNRPFLEVLDSCLALCECEALNITDSDVWSCKNCGREIPRERSVAKIIQQ